MWHNTNYAVRDFQGTTFKIIKLHLVELHNVALTRESRFGLTVSHHFPQYLALIKTKYSYLFVSRLFFTEVSRQLTTGN